MFLVSSILLIPVGLVWGFTAYLVWYEETRVRTMKERILEEVKGRNMERERERIEVVDVFGVRYEDLPDSRTRVRYVIFGVALK